MSQGAFGGAGGKPAGLTLSVWGGAVETHSPFGVTRVTLQVMFEHCSHWSFVYPR